MVVYRRMDDLTVTCRLTAFTLVSAPGPTLGIEYGKPYLFLLLSVGHNYMYIIKMQLLQSVAWDFYDPSYVFQV